MTGPAHNEYEAPVAGDGVRYTAHDGSVVEGVLAEVYYERTRLRARVCDSLVLCLREDQGEHLDYCRLRRIPR